MPAEAGTEIDYSTEEEQQFTERLQELKDCLDNEDFGQAVKLCEESLLGKSSNASSEMIYEVYAKALLHLGEYSKLVEEVKPPSAEVRSVLEPLQAYAFYRLEQYERASANSSTTSTVTADAQCPHIKAQSLYYLHDTQKALQCYQDLLEAARQNDDEELTMEVLTNVVAVLTANATPYENTVIASSEWLLEQALALLRDTDNYSYDLAYNLASLQLLSSHTASARHEALALLQQAQKQCVLQTDNDKSEAEPILLQQHWSRAFWGEAAPPKVKTVQHKVNGLLAQYINPQLLQDPKSKVLPAFLERVLQAPKITALQTRLVQYNLALVYLYANELNECRQTLDNLSQTLTDKKSKNKKKSAAILPTPSDLDTLWWQVRVDILRAYSFAAEEQQQSHEKEWSHVLQILQDRHDKLSSLPDGAMRNHILLYLTLHRRHLKKPTGKDNDKGDDDDEQWLMSHKQYPAVTASLAQLYQEQNQPEKAQALLSVHAAADTMLAEMALAQGDYEKAIGLHEQQLSANSNDKDGAAVVKAKLVEALSHVDPQRACQEWRQMGLDDIVDEEEDDESLDGQALEQQELPRLQRHQNGSNATFVGVDGGTGTNNDNANSSNNKGKKKSKAAIMRRRAKQRQAYLEKLQQKGLYSPSKPIPPDPERWIPRAERQRRRRRGHQQSKASQGGYSAKDAAQLDVAARATGQVEPKTHSTAHMSVAGSKARTRR